MCSSCFCGCGCADFILAIIAIVFPPLPVWIRTGCCSADSFINIALCILGFIPGLIHSWYIIAKYPPDHEYDVESQSSHCHHHTVYVRVPSSERTHSEQRQPVVTPQPTYGSTSAGSSSNPEGPPPSYTEFSKN